MADSGIVSIVKTLTGGGQIQLSPKSAGTIEVYADSTDLDLGHLTMDKYVDFVVIEVEGKDHVAGLVMDLTAKERTKDVGRSQSFSLAASDQAIPLPEPVQARFFKFRISDLSPTGRWKVSGIEFWGQVMEGPIYG